MSLIGNVASGAGTGALLGTVIPGLGNIAGGLIGGGVGLISGLLEGDPAKQAAQAQIDAANKALPIVQQGYQTGINAQQPYLQGGTQSFNTLNANTNAGAYNNPSQMNYQAPGDYQTQPFNFNVNTDPGAQFRFQQGQAAVQNGAAAQGKGLSSATQKALARYGSNLANQEYQNAFTRNQSQNQQGMQNYSMNRNFNTNLAETQYAQGVNENQRHFSNLGSLANMGQTAANNIGTLASNQGNAIANIYGQQGNAQAAGIMGSANATQAGLNNLSSAAMAIPYMQKQYAQNQAPAGTQLGPTNYNIPMTQQDFSSQIPGYGMPSYNGYDLNSNLVPLSRMS